MKHVRRRPGREDAPGKPRSPLTPAAMMAGPGEGGGTTRRSLGLRAVGRFLGRVIPPRTNFNQAPPPGRWRHLRRSSAFQQLPEPSPPPPLPLPPTLRRLCSCGPRPYGRRSPDCACACREVKPRLCGALPEVFSSSSSPRPARGLSSRALFRKVLRGGTLWLRTPERKLLS